MSIAASFWDVEDTDAASLKVRDMTVSAVSSSDVAEFCRRYHYTGRGGSDMWRWGLWHGQVLLGIVTYNILLPKVCAVVFGPDHAEHVCHMSRLALADHAPRNSESRLISGSIRAIAAQQPSMWAVLTYADATVGHLGYVYQATNALYTGLSDDGRYFTDQSGALVSHRTVMDKGITTQAQAKSQGFTIQHGPGKHRYLYILGSKTQRKQRRRLLKLPVLPYPKAEQVGT